MGRRASLDKMGSHSYFPNMTENPTYESCDALLAERLSAVRRDAGLTLDDAAAASGVSRATLSRIERGETSPTAATLGRLCAAYRMTMSELVSIVDADVPRVIARAEAPFWEDKNTGFKRWAISPPAQGYAIELVWGELPPHARVSYDLPPVVGIEHHFVLLEGVLRLTFDDVTYNLKRHDCLRLKVRAATVFENPGAAPAHYLIAVKKTP